MEGWASVYTWYPNRMPMSHESSMMSKGWDAMSGAQGFDLQASGVDSHKSLGAGE